jgi:hypothetical protein
MTAQTRPTNTGRFEQGDAPQGSDFADLIDSFIALVDTTAQTVASDLRAANFITSGKVSAATLNIATLNATNLGGSTVSGALVVGASASFTNLAIADTVRSANLHVATSGRFAGTLEATGKLSAANASFSAIVSATTLIVNATAQFSELFSIVSGNAITIVTASAGTGRILPLVDLTPVSCYNPYVAGFLKIRVGNVTACVPFWRSST